MIFALVCRRLAGKTTLFAGDRFALAFKTSQPPRLLGESAGKSVAPRIEIGERAQRFVEPGLGRVRYALSRRKAHLGGGALSFAGRSLGSERGVFLRETLDGERSVFDLRGLARHVL